MLITIPWHPRALQDYSYTSANANSSAWWNCVKFRLREKDDIEKDDQIPRNCSSRSLSLLNSNEHFISWVNLLSRYFLTFVTCLREVSLLYDLCVTWSPTTECPIFFLTFWWVKELYTIYCPKLYLSPKLLYKLYFDSKYARTVNLSHHMISCFLSLGADRWSIFIYWVPHHIWLTFYSYQTALQYLVQLFCDWVKIGSANSYISMQNFEIWYI